MLQYDQKNVQKKDEKNDHIYITLDIGKPQDCKQDCRYFWRDLGNIAIPFIFFIGILFLLFPLAKYIFNLVNYIIN